MPPPPAIPQTPQELAENRRRMQTGELYYAFTPELVEARSRCAAACDSFNKAPAGLSRRDKHALWADLVHDERPLPPPAASPAADDALLADLPWIEAPLRMDYGHNVHIGAGSYVNYNSTWIDTAPIMIGPRTLIGPNCSFYSGTHPLDPDVRNGIRGPEMGRPIVVGADCWFGGQVIVLPGITIGDGAVIGAGSVVTKDVAARTCVAGNPARYIKCVVSERPKNADEADTAETTSS